MSFDTMRGGNSRRHEVDFGDDPIVIDVIASTLTVQITVHGVEKGVAPERRRFATIALPREQFMAASMPGRPVRAASGRDKPGYTP